jgi:5-methylcytosine-specific restriction endonuclease McrA
MNYFLIRNLSDAEVVSGLKSSVSDERKKTTEVLEFLRELDRRRLYADFNCESLWEFCVKQLGYSAGSASRRVTAMRLLREMPELKEDLESGKLNLTSLSQAGKFFVTEEKYSGEKLSSEEKAEILEKMEGKSTRECELELIRMSSAPIELSHPEKERVMNDDFTEWKLVLSSELLEKLKRVQALRSHAQPSMSRVELLEYMADEVLKRLDPIEKEKEKEKEKQKKAKAVKQACEKPQSSTSSQRSPEKNGSSSSTPDVTQSQFKRTVIPAKTRRLVWMKAEGKCQFVDLETGKRCGSRYFLEIDHSIKPVALGGSNDPENLMLLCRGHNARAAVKVFGPR